ncbi:hypothetical protein PAPYR_4100 [Paratrimastix pyriformis]|uniref:Protein YIPF n=1 Tax=Paratrimastix pyriformis TaxID=342808 RepID=A0ABQ8ULK7_9EUKA|nr:hypothetical protein PAPYR_4100 [Paratrimastix pyriformis]
MEIKAAETGPAAVAPDASGPAPGKGDVWFQTADVATSSSDRNGTVVLELNSTPSPAAANSLPAVIAPILGVTGPSVLGGIQSQVANQLAQTIFLTTKTKANGVFQRLTDYESFRPFFDLPAYDLLKRLAYSIIPSPMHLVEGPPDFYGPLMCLFTLIALINIRMKTTGITGGGAALLGSSFALVLPYFMLYTILMWGIAALCKTQLSLIEIVSATGYSLFGYVAMMLLSLLIPPAMLFWCILFGCLSSGHLGLIFFKRTPRVRDGAIPFLVGMPVHLLYLLYLGFASAA